MKNKRFFFERYRWIKNGKNFNWQAYDDRIAQQLGSGSLRITRPRDEDLGRSMLIFKVIKNLLFKYLPT